MKSGISSGALALLRKREPAPAREPAPRAPPAPSTPAGEAAEPPSSSPPRGAGDVAPAPAPRARLMKNPEEDTTPPPTPPRRASTTPPPTPPRRASGDQRAPATPLPPPLLPVGAMAAFSPSASALPFLPSRRSLPLVVVAGGSNTGLDVDAPSFVPYAERHHFDGPRRIVVASAWGRTCIPSALEVPWGANAGVVLPPRMPITVPSFVRLAVPMAALDAPPIIDINDDEEVKRVAAAMGPSSSPSPSPQSSLAPTFAPVTEGTYVPRFSALLATELARHRADRCRFDVRGERLAVRVLVEDEGATWGQRVGALRRLIGGDLDIPRGCHYDAVTPEGRVLAHLTVPGVSEGAPRLDVGTVVRLRPSAASAGDTMPALGPLHSSVLGPEVEVEARVAAVQLVRERVTLEFPPLLSTRGCVLCKTLALSSGGSAAAGGGGSVPILPATNLCLPCGHACVCDPHLLIITGGGGGGGANASAAAAAIAAAACCPVCGAHIARTERTLPGWGPAAFPGHLSGWGLDLPVTTAHMGALRASGDEVAASFAAGALGLSGACTVPIPEADFWRLRGAVKSAQRAWAALLESGPWDLRFESSNAGLAETLLAVHTYGPQPRSWPAAGVPEFVARHLVLERKRQAMRVAGLPAAPSPSLPPAARAAAARAAAAAAAAGRGKGHAPSQPQPQPLPLSQQQEPGTVSSADALAHSSAFADFRVRHADSWAWFALQRVDENEQHLAYAGLLQAAVSPSQRLVRALFPSPGSVRSGPTLRMCLAVAAFADLIAQRKLKLPPTRRKNRLLPAAEAADGIRLDSMSRLKAVNYLGMHLIAPGEPLPPIPGAQHGNVSDPRRHLSRVVYPVRHWLCQRLAGPSSPAAGKTAAAGSAAPSAAALVPELNEAQCAAVQAIVRGSHGLLPYLLLGPAGTGKSSCLVEAIPHLLADPASVVLLVAPSNEAADLVLEALAAAHGDVLRCLGLVPATELRSGGSGILRLNSPARRLESLQSSSLLPFCFTRDGSFVVPDPGLVRRCRLLVATVGYSVALPSLGVGGAGEGAIPLSHIIVDEASQATEPDILLPLSLAMGTTRIVLTGDPRQLGPVLSSAVARKYGLGSSLQERLLGSARRAAAVAAAAAAGGGAKGGGVGAAAAGSLTTLRADPVLAVAVAPGSHEDFVSDALGSPRAFSYGEEVDDRRAWVGAPGVAAGAVRAGGAAAGAAAGGSPDDLPPGTTAADANANVYSPRVLEALLRDPSLIAIHARAWGLEALARRAAGHAASADVDDDVDDDDVDVDDGVGESGAARNTNGAGYKDGAHGVVGAHVRDDVDDEDDDGGVAGKVVGGGSRPLPLVARPLSTLLQTTLTENYRSAQQLLDLPSRLFYRSTPLVSRAPRSKTAQALAWSMLPQRPSGAGRSTTRSAERPVDPFPLLGIGVRGADFRERVLSESRSYVNDEEARAVAWACQSLLSESAGQGTAPPEEVEFWVPAAAGKTVKGQSAAGAAGSAAAEGSLLGRVEVRPQRPATTAATPGGGGGGGAAGAAKPLALAQKDIAVITPFRQQVLLIRQRLREAGLGDISVGSTQNLQGSQRAVVLISTVLSEPYGARILEKAKAEIVAATAGAAPQGAPTAAAAGAAAMDASRVGLFFDDRGTNVALTRAESLLVVVGNPDSWRAEGGAWLEILRTCIDAGSFIGWRGQEGAPPEGVPRRAGAGLW
jgi:hypothetical protein